MLRHYIANADTGRDYIDFEFYSDHRADSKANKEDARTQYKREKGANVIILNTYLVND